MKVEPWLDVLQAAEPGGGGAWNAAFDAAGSAEGLLGLSESRLLALGFKTGTAARLAAPDPRVRERWRRWLEAPGRELVTRDSPLYPRLLAQLPRPPLALWLEGREPDLLRAPQIAIVGSRNPSRGGARNSEELARYLSGRGLTITSGLAAGIDAAAHRGALEGVGGTVAVLGSGVDTVYPALNRDLAARIAQKGLIVSEYAPGTPVRRYHFPQRNRLIAALSLGTLVVEATRRSGSLITARLAADYGREVFAVPGSIHNPLARGCHALLRQGAKLVEQGEDILVEIAASIDLDEAPEPARENPSDTSLTADPAYDNLLKTMGFDPAGIDSLAAATALTPAELSSMLLVLELQGLVEALPGGRYARLVKGNS